MRTHVLIILIAGLLVSCKPSVKGKNGVSYDSAVEYNDYIVERQERLVQNIISLRSLTKEELIAADTLLLRYTRQADSIIEEVRGMPAYRKDTALRNAAINSFGFYKKIFEKEYPPILRLRQKDSEQLTTEEIEEANAILERIAKEERELDAEFQNAQREYAMKNNMRITDNKLQDQINKMKKQD
jgi:hypothetical protein